MKYLIAMALLLLVALAHAQPDSLQQQLQQAQADGDEKAIADLLNQVNWYIAKQGDSSCLPYLEQSLQLAQANGWENLENATNNSLAAYYYETGHYDSAISYQNKMVEYYGEINDSASWGNGLLNRSTFYKNNGQYDLAMEDLLQAIVILEALPTEQASLAASYDALGMLKKKRGEYVEAEGYILKGLNLREELGDSSGISKSLNNLGNVLLAQEAYGEAIEYYLEALDIKLRLGKQKGAAIVMNNLGEAYFELNELNKAEAYYLQSLAIKENKGDTTTGLVITLNALGKLYTAKAQWAQATLYLQRAETLALHLDILEQVGDNYLYQSQLHEQQGQDREALQYFKKYVEKYQELFANEKEAIIANAEAKYQTEKLKREQLVQRTTIQLQEASLNKQEARVYALVMGIGLSVLLIITLFILYRSKERARKNEQTLKEELNHRVKNNLQLLSSVLSLQSQRIQDTTAKEAMLSGQNRVAAMVLIHRMLQQKETLHINVQTYLQELIDTLITVYALEETSPNTTINIAATNMDVQKAVAVGLITNELVSNAFKHAYKEVADPQLEVQFAMGEGHYRLMVKDNGPGIHQEATGDSFGLQLVHMLASQLKAKLTTDNQHGQTYVLTFSAA